MASASAALSLLRSTRTHMAAAPFVRRLRSVRGATALASNFPSSRAFGSRSSTSDGAGGSSEALCQAKTFARDALPFKGAVIDFAKHPGEAIRAEADGGADFLAKLSRTVEELQEEGAYSLWLDVPVHDATLAAYAARGLGFDFHHAEGPRCVLKKWIHEELEDTIPTPLATHQVGCAGLVTNNRGELLVIKERERHNGVRVQWKLPGGMLDRGEDIESAVTREVWEETGLRTDFSSVLSFWNRHGLAPWGQSDMYIVAHLIVTDADAPIEIDPLEISACRWMCMEEFARTEDHPLILELLHQYFDLPKVGGAGLQLEQEATVEADGVQTVPALGLQRVNVQWPDRPVCPTYVAKKPTPPLA